MLRLILGALIGGAIGAAIGSIGICSTGTCPFISSWWGGALFGALFGLVIANATGGAPATPAHLANVVDVANPDAFAATVNDAGEKPVLVDFYLNSCPPCRALMPQLYTLAGARADSLLIVKVNAGKLRALAEEYNVQGVPTLVLLRSGQTVARRTGYVAADELGQWVDSAR
jgi:thioredoxin 1